MIAALYKFGRLGNRLFTFSNLISFSEMHKVPLVVPAFDDYTKYFSYFKDCPSCTYGISTANKNSVMPMVFIKVGAKTSLLPTVRFWEERSIFFDYEDKEDPRVRKMTESRLVVFEGWNFRSRKAIWESRDNIRKVFTPTPEIAKPVSKRVEDMKSRGDILIGIHVRWGDYRGTERFYELGEYIMRMKELSELYSPAKPVFLVFSDEPISNEQLPKNAFFCSGKVPVEDMYTLAECDCIVGPPSTFSMWASYYGGHPLFLMKRGRKFTDVNLGKIASP